jgi:hypothetical protein
VASNPGTHWLLLIRFADGVTVFYDSFGRALKNSFTKRFDAVITPYYLTATTDAAVAKKKKKKNNNPPGGGGGGGGGGVGVNVHLPCYDFDLDWCFGGGGINNNDQGIVKQFFPSKSFIQDSNTTLCGLYCIFLAHHLFSNSDADSHHQPPPLVVNATENTVLQFISNHFGENFPRLVKYY